MFKNIQRLLPKAMHQDRIIAQKEIHHLRKKMAADHRRNAAPDENLKNRIERIEKILISSASQKQSREANRLAIAFDDSLPITARKDDIIDAIKNHPVLIISGETGSGKTTQIPKFCLAAGRGIDGKIGCTQPRRIAAISVSNRIAEELGEPIGKSVGYKIRFKDKTNPNAYIKIMTDGILLAETQGDKYLNEYDTIIVDEAHERSLNIDFILGILRTLLKKRKGLKIIITSATIDTEKFSRAFDNAPVIEVSGRMYPVEVLYENETAEEESHVEMAIRAVETLYRKRRSGDILIFMPTEQDIRETCEIIEGRQYKDACILPLFARLSAEEQSRVFAAVPMRKIIVATNIAETSLTIPGIKYVIDTGLARISQYIPGSGMTSLPVAPISQSSADQRKGRCGRVENGVCIRLFSEEDFNNRPVYTQPEILRSNLAEVILRMIALELGDISDFPFIDSPAIKHIKDGSDTLIELGAITTRTPERGARNRRTGFLLTENGRFMATMPIDPRLSRMLIEAGKEGCLEEIAVIVSALSVRDPRDRPEDRADEADRAHAAFIDPFSDFMTLLNIWDRYHDIWAKKKTVNQMKKFCRDHYLSFKRIREWRDIHAQIVFILEDHGLAVNKKKSVLRTDTNSGSDSGPDPGTHGFSPLYTAVHRSILSGYLSHIAEKKEKNMYRAARGKEVMMFPGSGIFDKAKPWIVFAEMVETSRVFARTAAAIDCAWLEVIGGHLCKYTYLEPHWERNRGEVVASEQVSLFGLIIVSGRPASYGRIHPEEASDIFIRSALVEGDIRKPFPFMAHNRKLIDDVRDMENRIRKRDILISEEDLFEFYKTRLGCVFDVRSLQNMLKKKGGDSFLRMKKENMLQYVPDPEELSMFPVEIKLGGRRFDCRYRFDPGADDDGVTVDVPSSFAPDVPAEALEWVVPGLFREKLAGLIKNLPKAYRRRLVPIADTVEIILREMPKKEASLFSTLGEFIYNRFGVDIPASAWSDNALPDYLKMRISVTGVKGETLYAGRDSDILKKADSIAGIPDRYKKELLDPARKKWEKTAIKQWDFPDLPESIVLEGKDNMSLTVYPGLEKEMDNGGRINLRLFLGRDKAIETHQQGIAALYGVLLSKDLKFLKKSIVLPDRLKLHTAYFGGKKHFENSLYEKIVTDLFRRNIRAKNIFLSHAEVVAPGMIQKGQAFTESVMPVLEGFHETRTAIDKLKELNRQNKNAVRFLENIKDELIKLIPENFITLYDSERFIHIPRYIKAIDIRARRAVVDLEKDRLKAGDVKRYSEDLNALVKEISPKTSPEKRKALEDFFWMIEEYKVSVFAQEIKTAIPVSGKRLDERIKEINRMV